MKSGFKTLATWLIIGLVILCALSGLLGMSDNKITYSELVTKISSGEITKIVISADGISVTAY